MTEITRPANNAITESIAVAKTVTALTAPLIEIRDRLSMVRYLLNRCSRTAEPQDGLIAKIGQLRAQLSDDDASLRLELKTWAEPGQITSLVGVMALGFTGRTGSTSGYAGALLGALVAEDLEEPGVGGSDLRPDPISAPVIALAITRLWQHGKTFLPSPSEFRDECVAARHRVRWLQTNVLELLPEPITNPVPTSSVKLQHTPSSMIPRDEDADVVF
jgi:hypothetical protein